MALISCPDCGTQVSSAAPACVNCGRPLTAQPQPEVAYAAPPYGAAGAFTAQPGYYAAPGAPAWAAAPEIALHPMSESKLAVMSVFTLGLYPVYWFYRNWELRKTQRNRDVIPVLRAIFSPLFSYSLFEDVEEEAQKLRTSVGWSPMAMALTFFVLNVLWRLPDPFWLLCLFTFVPLLSVQRTINELNARSSRPAPVNAAFSTANVIGLIVGGIFLLLAIIGTFVEA
jgi:hypothetical protein